VSIKRRDVIKHFQQHGFSLLREGRRHSVFTNGIRVVPIKRSREIDRITANEPCKQAGIPPKF
jgi:predicted RNA binding protein YcfA (HicA-like mRNA interferase family)